MRPFVRIAAALLLVLSLGLHWALLQSVAWTGMIISYSQGASFKEAVSKTFDGDHPCRLCKVIEESRAAEHEQDQQQIVSGSKLDVALVWQSASFNFIASSEGVASHESRGLSRREEPPKPRPRKDSSNSLA